MTAPQLTRYADFFDRIQANQPSNFEVRPDLQQFATPGNIILTAVYRRGFGQMNELHAEVQYNQATQQIKPPIMGPKYVLHSIFRGNLEIETIQSDQEMRDYCIQELLEYQEITNFQAQNIQNIPLDELIQTTIEAGSRVIEADAGYALRSVVRGQGLTVFQPAVADVMVID